MLGLANRGVDVLRLDAVPFLWKRMGTDCQNQPEAHLLVQAFRALTRVAAPGLLFKAEAIVAPEMLVQYLGRARPLPAGVRPRLQQPAHGAALVVAGGPGRPAGGDRRWPGCGRRPAATGWVTYLRCHDDIGWAVSDTDAAAVGWNGFDAPPASWPDFYAGRAPRLVRPRRGVPGERGDRATRGRPGWPRRCAGSRPRAGDAAELDAAVRRLETLYSVVFSFGGIPLLWMGDELGAAATTATGGPRTRARRTTTAGCTGRRWTGPPPGAGD